MNRFFIIAGLLLLPALALAQVTVNPAALQQLAGITASIPVTAAPISEPVAPIKHPTTYRASGHWIKVVRRVGFVVLKPNPEPVAKPLPPKPVPVVARIPAPVILPPVTLTFAGGSAELPASAAGALKPYCKSNATVAINARAAGDPSDPSVAMRLSLARAMAVRDALTACGMPAQNIIPRALGEIPGANNDETRLAPAP